MGAGRVPRIHHQGAAVQNLQGVQENRTEVFGKRIDSKRLHGKKTRKYSIEITDVVDFLYFRDENPLLCKMKIGAERMSGRCHSEPTIRLLEKTLSCVLEEYLDVLEIPQVMKITGYKHQTILNWCNKDKVEHFLIRMRCMIPKTSLMEYLAADGFHAINAESKAYILVRNRK